MSSNQSIQQLISATRDLVPSREAARRPAGTAEFSEILRRHNTDDRPEIDRADQAARRPVEERPERSAPTRHADNRSDRTDAADDDIDRYRTERNDDTEPVSRSKSRDRSDQVSPRDEAETPSDPETAGTDDADGETVKTAETTNGETTESVEIALNDDAEALLPFVTEAEAVAEAEIAAPVETVITAVAKTTAPTLPEGSAPAEGSATSEATALEGAGKSAQVAGLRPATAEPAPQVAAAGAVGEANRAAVAANAAAVGGDIAIQASAGRTHKPTLDGTGSGDGDGDTPAAIRTPATDVSGADPDAQPNRASDTAKPAQFAARPGYAPVFAETVRQAMAGNTKAGTADTMLDNSALGAAPRGAMTFGNIRLSPVNSPVANPSLSAPAIAAEIVRAAHNGHTRFEIRLDPPELGRIDVKLDIADDGQVRTHLIVEKSETLDLLQRDGRALERALQQAGLKSEDGSLQFSLRDSGTDPQGQFSKNGNADRAADGSAEAAGNDPAEPQPVAAGARYMIAQRGLDLVV